MGGVEDRFGTAPKQLAKLVSLIVDEGEDAARERLKQLDTDELQDLAVVATASVAGQYLEHQAAPWSGLGEDPVLH